MAPREPVSAWWRRVSDHWWNRQGRYGVWWIPDEAPGPVGGPELWIDEAALAYYARGDATPAVTVIPGPGGGRWIGASIRFAAGYDPGGRKILDAPVVYRVVSRRWDAGVNGGRPYYVCTWPD